MISTKRIFLTVAILLCAVAGLFFAAATAAWLLLPPWLESTFIPRLAARAGITEFDLHVRSIDLDGIDLEGLRIGPSAKPDLQIRSIAVDYTLNGLTLLKRADQIQIQGIELPCGFKNGKLTIPILNWQIRSGSVTTPSIPAHFPVKKCIIRNSVLICDLVSGSIRIPFDMDLNFPDSPTRKLDCSIRLFAWKKLLSATASIDLESLTASAHVEAEEIDLVRFEEIYGAVPGLRISGTAGLDGDFRFTLAPFGLTSAETKTTLDGIRLEYRSWCVETPRHPAGQSTRVLVELLPNTPGTWEVSVNRLALVSPYGQALDASGIKAVLNGDGIKGSGQLGFRLKAGADNPFRFHIDKDIYLTSDLTASLSRDRNWELHLDPPEVKTVSSSVQFQYGSYAVSTSLTNLSLSAQGNLPSGMGKASAALKLPRLKAISGGIALHAASAKLDAAADWGPASRKGSFGLSFHDTNAIQTGAALTLPRILVDGNWLEESGKNPQLYLKLQFADGKISIPTLGVELSGLNGRIPFQWPAALPTPRSGALSISEIQWNKLKIGSLSLNLRQGNSDFEISGTHENRLLPGLSALFSGNLILGSANAPRIKGRIALSYPDTAPEIHLSRIVPGAPEAVLRGQFGINGDFIWTPIGLKGSATSNVSGGNFLWEKNKINVEGIRLELNQPFLPELRSAPAQKLYFSKASVGSLSGSDGRIDFQIESPKSLLLEKTRFAWCGGIVTMEAARIKPGKNDYDIVLYCDRLKLTDVLEQFGAARAEGGGTLTGRIPLKIRNGNIRFRDGFLFSAPGETGRLHLTGTEILTAGIPPDTPQYVQLELAREALKDYEYKWAKLNLNTEGEELMLRLQLDGKPGNPLPFVYNKDLGGFAKIEGTGEASVFEGIRLDVNFRLPLDKLLQYKDFFNSIR